MARFRTILALATCGITGCSTILPAGDPCCPSQAFSDEYVSEIIQKRGGGLLARTIARTQCRLFVSVYAPGLSGPDAWIEIEADEELLSRRSDEVHAALEAADLPGSF